MQSQSNHEDATGEELIGCVICYQLATRDALKKHIESHYHSFPYKCQTCGMGANDAGGMYRHAEETGHRVALNAPTSPFRKLVEATFTECINQHEAAKKVDGDGSVQVEPNEEESYSRGARSTRIEAAPKVPSSTSGGEIHASPKFVVPRNGVNGIQSVFNASTLKRSATPMKLQSAESASTKARNTHGESSGFDSGQTSRQSDTKVTDIRDGRMVSPLRAPSIHSQATQSMRRGSTRRYTGEESSAGVVCKLCDEKVIEGARRDHVATKHAKYAFRCPVAVCNYRTPSLYGETAFEQLNDHLNAQHGGRKNLSRREKDEVTRQVEVEKDKRLHYYEQCFPKRGDRMERRGEKRIYATPSAHKLADKGMKRRY